VVNGALTPSLRNGSVVSGASDSQPAHSNRKTPPASRRPDVTGAPRWTNVEPRLFCEQRLMRRAGRGGFRAFGPFGVAAIACATGRPPVSPVQQEPERRACLIDKGCPPSITFEPCAETPPARTQKVGYADLGQEITVRGKLVQGVSITEMACPPAWRCCNGAEGSLYVDGVAGRLRLMDSSDEAAFRCRGDDTLVCCTHSAGKDDEVIVTGVLTGDDPEAIDHPKVCVLRSPPAPSVR